VVAEPAMTRWAAKEAIYKALYPLHKPTWKGVEILPKDWSPSLTGATISTKLHVHFTTPQFSSMSDLGRKAPRVHLSISHDEPYVVAMVVVEAA
jgi:holo-[acyl-carrier protein] synthase